MPASSGEAEGAVGATGAAAEPGNVPPEEVLSGSNIFSTAEACLLAWMNAHAVKVFPKLVSMTLLSPREDDIKNALRITNQHLVYGFQLAPQQCPPQVLWDLAATELASALSSCGVGPSRLVSHCRTCV